MRRLRAHAAAASLALAAALAIPLSGCAQGASSGDAAYSQVSASEAAAMMESEQDYVIVDVRTPEEYAGGHIPEAINIPVETIGDEEPAELPDKDQLIFVYCRSGNRSKQAAGLLAELGYANVVEFGGISSWDGEIVTD